MTGNLQWKLSRVKELPGYENGQRGEEGDEGEGWDDLTCADDLTSFSIPLVEEVISLFCFISQVGLNLLVGLISLGS